MKFKLYDAPIIDCYDDIREIPELPCENCRYFSTLTFQGRAILEGCISEEQAYDHKVEFRNACESGEFRFELRVIDEAFTYTELDGFTVYPPSQSGFNYNLDRVEYVEFGEDIEFNLEALLNEANIGSTARVDLRIYKRLIEGDPTSEELVSTGSESLQVWQESNFTIRTGPMSSNGLTVVPCSGPGAGNNDKNIIENTLRINPSSGECVRFFRGDMVFRPGSSIIVESGTLRLEDVHLWGCQGMWDRIEVRNGATLEMVNCIVEDGTNAVLLRSGATAIIRNNTFRNNLTALRINNTSSTVSPAFVTDLYGNTFEADGNLVDLDSNNDPQKARHGIHITNGALNVGVQGQAPNRFLGLLNGIYSQDAILSVSNSEFENIFPLFDVDDPYDGRGILIENSGGYNGTFVTGENVRMSVCRYGIEGTRSNLRVTGVQMDQVEIGVLASLCQNRVIRIKNNDIKCFRLGVGLIQNLSRFAEVKNNSIEVIKLLPVLNNEGLDNYYGILLNDNSEFPTSAERYEVESNSVNLRSEGIGLHTGTGNGINLLSNTVTFDSERSNQIGINMAGTQSANVSCNNVMGAVGAPMTAANTAIKGFSLSGTQLQCNMTSNTNKGFEYAGMSGTATMKGNRIKDHGIGLLMQPSAVIGKQEHHGNSWCGEYSIFGAQHFGTQVQVEASQFIVDPDMLPDPNDSMPPCFSLLVPPSISAAGTWFDLQSPMEQTTFSCFSSPATCLLSDDEEPGPIREKPDGIGFKLATGQLHAAQFEAAQAWAGKRHLYERLLEHQDTIEQWKRIFLDSMEQHSIGQLTAIDLLIGETLQLSEQEQESLEQSFQQQNEWLQEWRSFGALDGHTDSLILRGQQMQLLDSLSAAAQSSSQLLQSVQQSRSSALAQADLLNNLVSTDSVYDTNERFVNELFLSTIAQGNLPDDELEIEQLWSIATQCPLEGGDAVFRARSIYRLFDPLVYFPDDSLCQNDSLELRQPLKAEKQLPELTYRLFPNPSSGRAPQASFSHVLSQQAIIQVFRANGSAVSDLSIQSGVQHTMITGAALEPGVYLCIITLHDGQRLPVERFVIIE